MPMADESETRPMPLTGVRVLDVSQVMAGPFASMLLGDMGADVIKIEPTDGGDQTRRAMGFKLKGNDSLGFFNLNRNKRSFALNLEEQARPRGVLRAGQDLRHPARELPARRDQAARHRLRDALQDQSAPDLCEHLGLRPDRTVVAAPGFRSDRASDGGHDEHHRSSGRAADEIGRAGLRHRLRAVRGVRHHVRAISDARRRAADNMSTARCSRQRLRSASGTFRNIGEREKCPAPLGTANRYSAPYQAVKRERHVFRDGREQQQAVPDALRDARPARAVQRCAVCDGVGTAREPHRADRGAGEELCHEDRG